MNEKTGARALWRRATRTTPRKIALVAALCLLYPVSCVVLDDAGGAGGACPRHNPDATADALPGTWKGPNGLRFTLGATSEEFPDGRSAQVGDVRARDWPFSLDDLDDEGRVREDTSDGTGRARQFDHGRGSWEFRDQVSTDGDPYSVVMLEFSSGTPEDDVAADPQYLGVGGTEAKPLLFVESDPDTCPSVVFHKGTAD
ncbi:hypothetical protein OG533_29690 [Streptomyces sp. NBC_01186]|uniref:hypothetical protein n=1 Tax=Streptomyces sp. NBC_01186 TaxID=2903765 RepID=UPI002E103C45|nr:hypothetical protein OG533_29690 [Streptomyces sp. NBC_01186]